MAVSDFLSGGVAPSTTSSGQSFTQLPQWYQDYATAILAKGNAVASEPFQTYPGQRFADLNSFQTGAQDLIKNNVGALNNTMNTSMGMAQDSSNPALNQDVLNSYMNPYSDQVVNKIAALGQRNLSENLLPQVNDTFTGNGMFGGDRHADITARTVRDANESILNQQTSALQQGFDKAVDSTNTGMARQQTGASVLGALGKTVQGMNTSDAAQMMAAGQLTQQSQQQNLDYAFNQFQNQVNYPKDQLGFLNSLLRGLQTPTSTTNTGVQQQSSVVSPLQNLVGLATAGLGVYNAAGG